jgi:hypothetical protein
MMKRKSIWILVPVFAVLLTVVGMALADRGEHRSDDDGDRGFFRRLMPQRMAYNTQHSQLYVDECGSCHFPFQAGFLPADSWRELMGGLQDHFGENAELAKDVAQQITEYLLANAAGVVDREIPNKAMWSTRFTPNPMRITETAFFRHEHREIPPRILQQEGNELSFVNCDSCHTRALQGSYNEHEIRIPGIGRWED